MSRDEPAVAELREAIRAAVERFEAAAGYPLLSLSAEIPRDDDGRPVVRLELRGEDPPA